MMPLDPQVKTFLDQLAAANLPDIPSLTPREARMQMDVGTMMLGKAPEVGRVEDHTAPGPAGPIRVRLTAPAGDGPFPVLVYFHGGGWVCGGVFSHDHLCRALTAASGVALVSVDYRLAPEHPYPAAVEDAEAATRWVAEHGGELGLDPGRLAVGGDSAGGNLAAVVARRARDAGDSPPIAYQALLYPATDADFETPSYRGCSEGYFLTRAAMIWYWDHYAPDPGRRLEPDAAPLRAPDLSGLPPALVLTAGYDPLRDEGDAYARRLAGAGVPVRHRRYEGMIHGFLRRHHLLEAGKAALADVAGDLAGALGVARA